MESSAVESHIRDYHLRLLQSGLQLKDIEKSHAEMGSSLHPLAGSEDVDVSAFFYSARRLPGCVEVVRRVLMVRGEEDLASLSGSWQAVRAQSRRRQTLFDEEDTLAACVSSISELDDLIPNLTCFQIEWNKMRSRVAGRTPEKIAAMGEEGARKALGLSKDDWSLLRQIWGAGWRDRIFALVSEPKDIMMDLLDLKQGSYGQATAGWWSHLISCFHGAKVEEMPTYLVSSNDHSFADLLSGFAEKNRHAILLHALGADEKLEQRWRRLRNDVEGQRDFLYYATKGYLESEGRAEEMRAMEEDVGIQRYQGSPLLDLGAQIIDIGKLRRDRMDPRLSGYREILGESQALILNVNYPLGQGAYHLLSQVQSGLKDLRGVYIMGKAAIMTGRLGDVIIPRIVYDTNSKNIFSFENCFSLKDLVGYLRDSAVFDNQKAVTVRGTFLHSKETMEVFKREDYNSIEMEAGPYLCALYEGLYGQKCPQGEQLRLEGTEMGMLHYASDTPYSRRVSLLSKRLGLAGVEATSACSLAILKRIFQREVQRLEEGMLG